MMTLLNLIDIVKEYFEWSYGIIVTGFGAGFLGAGPVMAFIVRPPKAAKKAKTPEFIITEDQDVSKEDLQEAKTVKKPKRKPVSKSRKQ